MQTKESIIKRRKKILHLIARLNRFFLLQSQILQNNMEVHDIQHHHNLYKILDIL